MQAYAELSVSLGDCPTLRLSTVLRGVGGNGIIGVIRIMILSRGTD